MGSVYPPERLTASEAAIHHPACPNCGVKMWLTKIDHFAGLPPESERQHFECQACGASAILPPL